MSHRPAAFTEWYVFAKGRNGRWHMVASGNRTKADARRDMDDLKNLYPDATLAIGPAVVEPCECVDSDYLESQL